jgi:hypothetical protein
MLYVKILLAIEFQLRSGESLTAKRAGVRVAKGDRL